MDPTPAIPTTAVIYDPPLFAFGAPFQDVPPTALLIPCRATARVGLPGGPLTILRGDPLVAGTAFLWDSFVVEKSATLPLLGNGNRWRGRLVAFGAGVASQAEASTYVRVGLRRSKVDRSTGTEIATSVTEIGDVLAPMSPSTYAPADAIGGGGEPELRPVRVQPSLVEAVDVDDATRLVVWSMYMPHGGGVTALAVDTLLVARGVVAVWTDEDPRR